MKELQNEDAAVKVEEWVQQKKMGKTIKDLIKLYLPIKSVNLK